MMKIYSDHAQLQLDFENAKKECTAEKIAIAENCEKLLDENSNLTVKVTEMEGECFLFNKIYDF